MLTEDQVNNPPYVPAKYFHVGRVKHVELIVIHTMEAPDGPRTAENVAHYFQEPAVEASAHYCIDVNAVIQCVYDSNTAFACKNANANGMHLEHAGYAAQTACDWADEYNQKMLYNSAQIAAYLVKKFNIPVQRAEFAGPNDPTVTKKGFCGHVEVPLHGSHTDPGDNFPWDTYFDMINSILQANGDQAS